MTNEELWIVLLRGINVGGHRKVPMADLRELATNLGMGSVATYVNSGNLLGTSELGAEELRLSLEGSLLEQFGFEVDVVVRAADQLQRLASLDVFREAQTTRSNLVHVVFGHEPATSSVLQHLEPYLTGEERAQLGGGELWIDFANGSARSKVTHDVLRRAFGGVATARNFRTIQKLAAMTTS